MCVCVCCVCVCVGGGGGVGGVGWGWGWVVLIRKMNEDLINSIFSKCLANTPDESSDI